MKLMRRVLLRTRSFRAPFFKTVCVGGLFIVAIGFCRVYVSARSGSEEFASSLRALDLETIGRIVDRRTPAEASPDAQLDFWREETDRILEEHADDPELHAAAALLLHEPTSLYFSDLARELAEQNPKHWDLATQFFERARNLRLRFDTEGSQRANQLVRRATELDPDDVRWWRLRAVLLWPGPLANSDSMPFDSDGERILNEAMKRDPDNALYAVLLAYHNSQLAIDFDERGNFVIANDRAWNRTIQFAESCSNDRKMKLGEPGMSGMVRLHSLSEHPRATTSESIRARFVATRAAKSACLLARNLLRMSEVQSLRTNDDERDKLLRLAQSIVDLAAERSDAAVRYDSLTVQMRTIVRAARVEFDQQRNKARETLDPETLAAERWEQAFQTAATEFSKQDISGVVPQIASRIALKLFAVLLGISVLGWLLAALCRSRLEFKFGVWVIGCFIAAFATSAVLLGVGPAGYVGVTAQQWMLTTLSFVCLALAIGGVASRTRLRFRYSLRGLMLTCAAVAIILQVTFHFQLGWEAIGLPIPLHATSNPLLSTLQSQSADATLAVTPTWPSRSGLEWLLHEGPAWTAAIFLLFSAISILFSRKTRHRCMEWLSVSTGLALCFLIVWVWLEPFNYQASRPAQMRLETYIRSVEEYYEPLETLIERELHGSLSVPPGIPPSITPKIVRSTRATGSESKKPTGHFPSRCPRVARCVFERSAFAFHGRSVGTAQRSFDRGSLDRHSVGVPLIGAPLIGGPLIGRRLIGAS